MFWAPRRGRSRTGARVTVWVLAAVSVGAGPQGCLGRSRLASGPLEPCYGMAPTISVVAGGVVHRAHGAVVLFGRGVAAAFGLTHGLFLGGLFAARGDGSAMVVGIVRRVAEARAGGGPPVPLGRAAGGTVLSWWVGQWAGMRAPGPYGLGRQVRSWWGGLSARLPCGVTGLAFGLSIMLWHGGDGSAVVARVSTRLAWGAMGLAFGHLGHASAWGRQVRPWWHELSAEFAWAATGLASGPLEPRYRTGVTVGGGWCGGCG